MSATEANFITGYFLGDDISIVFSDIEEDVGSAALTFVVRKHDDSETILIEKTTETSPPGIVVVASPQSVTINIADTDSYDPDVSPAIELTPGPYRYTLKRTDAGSETTLRYGTFYFSQGTAR